MSDDERKWHPNFIEYTDQIVNHSNYKGLFYERKADGQVKWVVAGNSRNGEKRREWWNEKCRKQGIKIRPACYAKIARIVHPSKYHVCQVCGREMNIFYIYPTKNLLIKLNNICENLDLVPFEHANESIDEILETLFESENPPFEEVKRIFQIPDTIKEEKTAFVEYIKENFVQKESSLLSPGVMSNSPDRFDGFHSDGLCHRSQSDKGRHAANLRRYGEDRRAYESWSSGNWKLASWYMKEYSKRDIKCLSCSKITKCSADHIGPISCGFAHSAFFNPLCIECNSAKNNRMNLIDIKQLLQIEEKEAVISWHSKYLWDNVKNRPKSDKEAINISSLMREHLHHILILFSILSYSGFKYFLLRFLNPKYAFYQYEFEDDNLIGLIDPNKKKKLEVNRMEHRRNAIRYIRISFESLEGYSLKVNRRLKFKDLISNSTIQEKVENLRNYMSKIYKTKIYSFHSIVEEIENNILQVPNREAVLAYLLSLKANSQEILIADSKLKSIIIEIGDFLQQNWDFKH